MTVSHAPRARLGRLRTAALVAAIVALTASLLPAMATSSSAQTTEVPCRRVADTTSLDAFFTHEELGERLEWIESTSRGNIDLEVAGYTNHGREIWAATVGTGPEVILIQSEIHGNEKTGTNAIVNLLRELGNNSRRSAEIREAVTVVAIPMLNADGGSVPRRQNVYTWDETVENFPQLAGSPRAWNYSNFGGGYDVNRDFNPDLDYVPDPADFPGNSGSVGWFLTPEAQTVRDVYRELEEDFGTVDVFVDLHHQGPCYSGEDLGRYSPLSISGRFIDDPDEHGDWPNFDFDASRRVNVAVNEAVKRYSNDTVTLYPQNTNLPGTALGSFALRGSATILFEVSGQTQSSGQRRAGYLINMVELGLWGILDQMADGTLDDIDPDLYDLIPERTNVPRANTLPR